MLRLCSAHRAELDGTIFRLHPYTRQQEQPAQTIDPAHKGDAMIVNLARFALVQEDSIRGMLIELHGVYHDLQQVRARNAVLEEA